jgi:hypothetical protein
MLRTLIGFFVALNLLTGCATPSRDALAPALIRTEVSSNSGATSCSIPATAVCGACSVTCPSPAAPAMCEKGGVYCPFGPNSCECTAQPKCTCGPL